MKLYILIVLCLFDIRLCYSQIDTAYVLFEYLEGNKVLTSRNHKENPHNNESYPYDSGRIYIISKKVGNFTRDMAFIYRSYYPDWAPSKFELKKVDTSFIEEKNFKDRKWFEKTDYDKILSIFERAKVIYLIDERYIKDCKAYMIRVYFNYPAVE